MATLEQAKRLRQVSANFHVADDGNDGWSGRRAEPTGDGTDGPFAGLTRARNAVRELKARQRSKGEPEPIIVEIGPGTWELTEPLELVAGDSGSENAPVVYRARPEADVHVLGGRVIGGFEPVTDPAVLERLDPAAHGHVLQSNLREQGITDFGEITAPEWAHGRPGLELFFKGRRMTLARWPNDEFVKIASIDVETNTPVRNRVTLSGRIRGSNEGRFFYEGDRPKRWVDEKDGWLHGHWFWDWADQRHRIESIDTVRRIITLEKPYHRGYRKGQWYYAFNLLCELDSPGEWYLDRDTGVLYFWPPESFTDGDVSVSMAPGLLRMNETSHVVFDGLTFENARETAIEMRGGTGNLVCACTIRNTSSGGVEIDGGTGHGVVGCDLYELGEGGIRMTGGDRVTLTPGGHYAVNNLVHHCSRWNPLYHPGIAMFGVGNRVAHNLLYELPHTAIGFTGNDQVIEYNEIHSAVYMANDAGSIYTSPPFEELTMYGHVIRHNYVHHIYGFRNRGCNGAVYLDDSFPGTTIYGNVFRQVPRAAFVGGGRYCTIENNIFVDCDPSVHIDARGLGWAAGGKDQLLELLGAYPYREEPWRSKYPSLVGILDDDPMTPKGNRVLRNVCVRGSWDEVEEKARPHVVFEDNLVDADPGFVDEAAGDFTLRENSPAFDVGFEPIPFGEIGLYEDELRASWPVEHEVREGGLDVPDEKTW